MSVNEVMIFANAPELEKALNSTLDNFSKMPNGKKLIVENGTTVKECIKEYVEAHPEQRSIIFYDCTAIHRQYMAWYKIFEGKIILCYAMKCNPDDVIMDLFSTFPGICFDCASPEEIQKVEERGIKHCCIIYANPTKSDKSILYMADHNVFIGTVDCPDEIEKMASVLGDRASKCKIVIRLWVPDDHSLTGLSCKYGSLDSELPAIMEACNNHNMEVVGFAFHVGSGGDSTNAYETAMEFVDKAIEVGKEHGINIQLLDIGGGFTGALADENLNNPWLENVKNEIFAALKKHNLDHLKLLSEPGRYFNNDTVDVVCHVTNVQERDDCMVYRINEGVDTLFKDYKLSNGLDYYVDTFVEGECCRAVFIGPSGQQYDVIDHYGPKNNKEIMIPRLKVGDAVLFRHMGAYTVSLNTEFLREKQENVYLIHESSLSEI